MKGNDVISQYSMDRSTIWPAEMDFLGLKTLT